MRTAAHLFCGLGGGALGFLRAGFHNVLAVDNNAAACRDYERLAGTAATCADLHELGPDDIRRLCPDAPDVVFTSPPCKGFSGCLSKKLSLTEHYERMNELSFRGVWIALEAWRRNPPRLLVLENVPRIRTRGRKWLERIVALLHSFGYAVDQRSHDCGVVGGLAQHRKRFLLVARHLPQLEAFLYVPPARRVRGIGEVLGELPVPLPGSAEGGPMHRLPRLTAINWIRLALIPAGGDWRDLPDAVRLPRRDARQNGPYGVETWNVPAHAVLGHTTARDTWGSVADPRVQCRRREGGHGVRAWDRPSATIIANPCIDNFPCQVADPRLGCTPGQTGHFGVQDWASPSHTVRAHFSVQNAPAAVADPRVPAIEGAPFDTDSRTPIYLVIRAADGTWHRPLTTLELAALQGLPVRTPDGAWLVLDGRAHDDWRERIGNAVPPPAAESIARSCAATLDTAESGWSLSSAAIWVRRHYEEALGDAA